MLNQMVNEAIDEVYNYFERSECVTMLPQDRHRNTLINAVAFQNMASMFHLVVEHGVYVTRRLQEAMFSLVHCY